MIKLLFLFIFGFCSIAHAETYAVDRADGGVSIISYNESASDTLQDVVRDLGFEGRPIKRISESDIPASREDRDSWTVQGKKIVIDTDKKQAREAAKAEKEAEKDAVLAKLKISKKEAEALKRVTNGI